MKKKMGYVLLVGLVAASLAGCSSKAESEAVSTAAETEAKEQIEAGVIEEAVSSEAEKASYESDQESDVSLTLEDDEEAAMVLLSELSSMVGMNDEETAELLGGGNENWTEDKRFYIGRIYSVELDGESYSVFTTCGDDKKVESVSMWIVNGERDVTEAEAGLWKERLTEFMGTEPMEASEVSEGGSKNYSWRADGMAASLHQMKDILSISIQPAVGELK